jgi:hypothetical protein
MLLLVRRDTTMSGKMLLDSRTKDEKASPECWRGEGFLSLCQRARGETKEEIGAMGREIESPQGIGYW